MKNGAKFLNMYVKGGLGFFSLVLNDKLEGFGVASGSSALQGLDLSQGLGHLH